MTWPTEQESLELLRQWLALHEQIETLMEGVGAVFGGSPESLMPQTIWAVFGAYTKQIGARIGDTDSEHGEDWLNWFCHENEMGSKGMEAGYDGKTQPISTLGHLYALIVEGRGAA